MSKEKTTVTSGGIGFTSLLTIVFIVLKLFKVTEVAEWTWLWVLSPLWIPFAVLIVILLVMLAMVVLKR